MKNAIDWSRWLKIAALLLLAPALLIHLGLMTFIDDEGIRSLVALEMKLSGNYITPTLHGGFYYKKPPLYNWIILLSFQLTGVVNEFTARFPTIICLLGYAATVYYFLRKHYNANIAFINAFLLITCGRILFWDSMLGLIDIGFAWVMFMLFMTVYHQYAKGRFWSLFLISYLLMAIGFMLKGLPAIVFQGCTLLAFFIYQKQFKKLFTLPHLVGGLLALFLLGTYYFIYHQYNSLQDVFTTLVTESSKRTAVEFGIRKTIIHLFTFPFEMIYHFLPWSLMIVYFLQKDIVKIIKKDAFITFNLLMFFANIIVYWLSVEVYPRYLLMHAPLIFSVYIYLHYENKTRQGRIAPVVEYLFFGLCAFIAVSSFAPLWLEQTQNTAWLYPKTLSVGLALVGLTVLYWFRKEARLLTLIVFLLVFRVGFNWFVLPDRNANDFGDLCRMTSKEVGQNFKDYKFYVYKDTDMQYTNSIYLTAARGQIIPYRKNNFESDALYIINPVQYPDVEYEKVAEIKVRHGKLTYDIVRLK